MVFGSGPGYDYADFESFLSTDSDPSNCRTLYVGNLDISISEEFLTTLFSQIGQVTQCKIIHETGNDPYAFVEFLDHSAAVQALSAMNKRVLLGREMKVNWATTPGQQVQKVDTSKHFHIFVGDLSPEIDNKTLKEAFAPFGQISDAKVIRDLQTLKSKGYGFVSFVNREDAERGIEQMNGQWLGRRTIRTNWATRKPMAPGSRHLNYEEVSGQSGSNNMTVYVGNTNPNTTEAALRDAFADFGGIVEVRIFKQQGYCFVRFDTKESACNAICNVNGVDISGSIVRCSWGREDGGQKFQVTGSTPSVAHMGSSSSAQQQGAMGNSSQQQQYPANYAANYWAQYYQQYYNNPAMYQQYAQAQAQAGAWPQGAAAQPGQPQPPNPNAPGGQPGYSYGYGQQ